MDQMLEQKLKSTLDECATHLRRMAYAHGKISEFLPTTADAIPNMTDAQVEPLDQYIYRFTKLQDAMGQRLFRQCLQLLAEDTKSMAFIDQLHRLEQLTILDSAQEWLELRQLRNLLAHEYSDSPQELANAINAAYSKNADLSRIFTRFKQWSSRYITYS